MKPTIEIYLGSSIEQPSENQFLLRLSSDLTDRGESAIIFANFFAGSSSRQIDFFVLTSKCACHVELKNYTATVIGGMNGPWKLKRPDGEVVVLEDYQNAYAQALQGKFAIGNVMRELAPQQSGGLVAGKKFFTTIESVICVYPELLPGSQVPNDYKVLTKGYLELLNFLCTHVRNPGWNVEDWRRFAMHLQLVKQTDPSENMEPKLAAAQKAVAEYQLRFKSFYSTDLPTLVGTSVQIGEQHVNSSQLLSYLSTGRHASLLGSSGAGKSLLAKHMMLDAIDHGWVPIILRAQTFDGKLVTLLDRSVAHLHPRTAGNLLTAAKKAGAPLVLVVDGYNECPDSLKGALLETLQAFYLRWATPVLVTSQEKVNLPEKLAGEELQLLDLTPAEKTAVFRSYCAQEIDGERLKSLTEPFRTPYEISLAAEGLNEFGSVVTRFQLFDSYIRRRCDVTSSPAAARLVLSDLSSEMAKRFTTSLPAWEAIGFVESALAAEPISIKLLDDIAHSGLLDVGQGFWSFRHELLGQFFAALALERTYKNSDNLAHELARPRNRNLAEFTLHLLTEPEHIIACFEALADPRVLYKALTGTIGTYAQQVAETEALRMFQRVIDDLTLVQLELKFPPPESPPRTWPILRIARGSNWSTYELCLLTSIGLGISDGRFIGEYVDLVERLESLEHKVLTDYRNEEKTASLDLQGMLFESFYVDQFVEPRPQFATAAIINAARQNTWLHFDSQTPERIEHLLKNVGSQRPGVLYFLCIVLRRYRGDKELPEGLAALLQHCWETGIYHLRIEALHLIQDFNILNGPRDEIKTILPTLHSKNVFVNSLLVEILGSYGLLEPVVELEAVSKELRQILETPEDVVARQQAHGAVTNIFEDIFQGVYDEAIEELSKKDKQLLYTMAALGAPSYGFFTDFILERLIKFDDPATLPAFKRWASEMDVDTPSTQEAVSCYELGVKGCARFMDEPPRLQNKDSNAWLAWQLYGELIFWTNKPTLDESTIREKCKSIWASLTGELVFAAVDPLVHLYSSDRKSSLTGGTLQDLFKRFRAPIRGILECGVIHLDSLSTIFVRGEEFAKKGRDRFVVAALGAVGNEKTIALLTPLIDSAELGALAVDSIRQLKQKRPNGEMRPLSIPY
jgi:hypothetical protein